MFLFFWYPILDKHASLVLFQAELETCEACFYIGKNFFNILNLCCIHPLLFDLKLLQPLRGESLDSFRPTFLEVYMVVHLICACFNLFTSPRALKKNGGFLSHVGIPSKSSIHIYRIFMDFPSHKPSILWDTPGPS